MPLMTVQEDTFPACRRCELTLRPIGAFGRADDPVLLRHFPRVERDGRARFYATVPSVPDHEIIVFEASGTVLGTVGRYGDGPGEFRMVWDMLVGPGDTLWVGHDAAVSLFDPQGGFTRRLTLDPPPRSPQLNRLVGLHDGAVLTSEYRRGDASGLPVHHYDPDGRYVRGFGPADIVQRHQLDRGEILSTFPRVARLAGEGTIWIGGPGYRLEGVRLSGEVVRVIGIRSPQDWHAPLFMTAADYEAELARSSDNSRFGDARGPPLSIAGVASFSDSLLLVVSHVSVDEQGRGRTGADLQPQGEQGETMLAALVDNRITIIDIVDPRVGWVVARTRADGMGLITRDGTLYVAQPDELGVMRVELFEVELRVHPGL